MIKDVIKKLNISSTLKINEISKDLDLQGKNIFKFGFGQSPFKVPENVIVELKNNAHQNKYLPMQGLPELREAVASYISSKKNYNLTIDNTDYKIPVFLLSNNISHVSSEELYEGLNFCRTLMQKLNIIVVLYISS